MRQPLTCVFLLMTMLSSIRLPAMEEKTNSGWQLNLDNNITGLKMHDRDYTAGIALTLSGLRARDYWFSVDPLRAGIDSLLNTVAIHHTGPNPIRRHSFQSGMVLFTPQNLLLSSPILDDRPYASLLYISNTRLTVDTPQQRALRSTFTLGALGLKLGGEIQKLLHAGTSSDAANGWDNQVSNGGEPTAMYTLSMQQHFPDRTAGQLTSHIEANVGFSTDVNAGVNWRRGVINTPWWSFNPSHSEYIGSAAASARGAAGSKPEFYAFAGANLKYRFYSAVLQGQFRDSVHTLGHHEIEHLLLTAWVGAAREFGDNLRYSLFIRGGTSEIRGLNARALFWAGLVVNRAW